MKSSEKFSSLKFVLFSFVIIVITSFFLNGCNKSTSPDNSNSDILFAAKFSNSWLCSDCGQGIIFISDTSGNILLESAWYGNSEIRFLRSDLDSIPKEISVTLVNRELGLDDRHIFIKSYLNLPIGLYLTFKGVSNTDSLGKVSLTFNNIPEHSDYRVSTHLQSFSSDWDTLYSPMTKTLYRNPDNCYIKLNTIQDGVKYLWLNNLNDKDSYRIDLSKLMSTQIKNIKLPNLAHNSVYFFLNGYLTDFDRYSGRYLLENVWINDSSITYINVHYPYSIFPAFNTNINIYDEEYQTSWHAGYYGDIPNTINLINANFEVENTNPNNFKINTSGTFDIIVSGWSQFDNPNNYIFNWHVFSGPDLNSYSLPELPKSVINKYPGIDRKVFKMFWVGLTDFAQIDNYNEWLVTEFKRNTYFYNKVKEVKQIGKFNHDQNKISFKDYTDFIINENRIPYYKEKN